MTKKEIAATVKSYRTAAGISKYSISNLGEKKGKLNYAVITKIETGKENYTVDNLLDYLTAIDRTLTIG